MLCHGVQRLSSHAESVLRLTLIDGANCLYIAIFSANDYASA